MTSLRPPRTPLARRGPGLMAATTVRVLAAEMSDAGRLTRGRRLRADGAVIDLAVGHGAVVAQVQGSRPDPYVVTLQTRPGTKAPTRRELTVRCTCPDDAGTGQHACKHAVAALLGLADELLVEPELLHRWRRSDQVDLVDQAEMDHTDDEEQVGQVDATDTPRDPPAPQHPAAVLLQAPGGASLPPLPELTELDHPPFPDPLLDQVLDDARHEVRIGWT